MKTRMGVRFTRSASALIAVFCSISALMIQRAPADQVDTVTGDHYTGRVISLSAETLILQNDVLGTIKVPRSKVTTIALGTNAPARPVAATLPPHALIITNSSPMKSAATDYDAMLRQLGTNSAQLKQVQQQLLAGAGPEANQKFSQMIDDLASGRMSMTDLRAQAKASADQLRAMKRELGGDDGGMLDEYLSILDSFVNETAPGGLDPLGGSAVKKP